MRALSDVQTMIKATTVASCEAVGGVSAAAGLLGIASSTLTKYASVAEEWRGNFIRMDLAVELDRRTDHPFFLSAMQRLVTGDKPEPMGRVTASAILRLDGVLDDVVREVARAIEDDHIDAAERQAIRGRIVAAKNYLARLDAMMVGGGA